MGRLDGKVALVTGGARGQGRAHALAMAREGADIAIVDICQQVDTVPYGMATISDLERTAGEIEALDRRTVSMPADMRSESAVTNAVKTTIAELNAIDVLVVNHGIWSRAALWEMSDAEWDDTLDTNLKAPWRVLKAVAPHMIERRSGSIILTSSVNGFEGQAGAAHYAAAKHGVLGLMRSAALELAPYGVRVNAICPGFVDTGMTDWQGCYDMTTGKVNATRQEYEVATRHFQAIGSGLLPEEVSGTVLWLASTDSSRVTGVAVPVDAGHSVLNGYNPAPTPAGAA